MMKTITAIVAGVVACCVCTCVLAGLPKAPSGFDTEKQGENKGALQAETYSSKTVGSERNVFIYTPPEFSREKEYPVLYLLHGIGGDEHEWLRGGQAKNILDNLYAEKKLVPMIVVLPNGRAMKDDRATGNVMAPDKVEAFATFEKDLLNDLIPFIEEKYPVIKNRENRAIAGLSIGGGQSLNFGLGNLDTFAWVGGFSSAPNTREAQVLVPDPEKVRKELKLLWLSSGDKDGLMGFTKRTHEYLEAHQVDHIYYIEPGVHDFKVWKNDLYLFSQLLFKPVTSETFGLYRPPNEGVVKPTYESLSENFQVPEWYRNAKFGIFAHWGPQCQAASGDWYARGLYEKSWQGDAHRKKYGHPSQFGFKDVINEWKAEKWNPDELVALYKKMGARYLVSLANHHDNFDLYNSKYQPWNSVNLGPQRDISKEWKAAAQKYGLHWGASVHASHAWLFYETAQGADSEGEYAGIPYDGKLTKADGKGLWWDGYDPQELYAQNHALSPNSNIHANWEWGREATAPSQAYVENFYKRTVQLVDDYQPELLYFDDTVLPFYPLNDTGLKIAAYYHNADAVRHGGHSQGVITGKVLDTAQRKALVWDVERGAPGQITTPYWQTDTCIGAWHYDQGIYERSDYKNSATVIRMLIDVVSKGGNLLLSMPIRGDGTLDEKELAVAHDIAHWMEANAEGIYDTTYWKVFGEGPQLEEKLAINRQGFNEGKGKPATAKDIRYTQKGRTVYAFTLGVPTEPTVLKAFAGEAVASVSLLGSQGEVHFTQDAAAGLTIEPPAGKAPFTEALTYKITLKQ